MNIFLNSRPFLAAAALSLLGMLSAFTPAMADDRGHNRHDGRQGIYRDVRDRVLDSRYHHNRYYPSRGHVVTMVPRGAVVARYGRMPYYFHGGVWYRPYGPRFVVVTPPFYTTLWARGIPYYYADDAYYVWRADRRAYEVAPPPDDAQVSTQAGDDVFIYPKSGQSEEQQSKDRYDCHSWASNQTGFDPTQQGGGVPEGQTVNKRADYLRAMTACLEGRGYSVK